jgi:hypothetical protein
LHHRTALKIDEIRSVLSVDGGFEVDEFGP